MARDEGEKFLSRWSRLKTEERQAEKAPERKPEAVPAQTPAKPNDPPAPQLPPIESLKGLASEYAEFLKPGVEESLRRSALKKLFKDPYFETFERFEAYCEDYTQGEPIPAAMLKTLEHAKRLLFDEKEEEKPDVAEEGNQAQATDEAPAPPPQPEEKKA
jgi:hypothetical protein